MMAKMTGENISNLGTMAVGIARFSNSNSSDTHATSQSGRVGDSGPHDNDDRMDIGVVNAGLGSLLVGSGILSVGHGRI